MARSPAEKMMRTISQLCLTAVCLWLLLATALEAGPLDEMSLERWAKLKEVERYQLNIAEKYYREQNWKTAAAEYEKFLSLYESSEGAPYAQLKWSLCQTQLKKLNTAIREGYQSVIDYWPESPEAMTAAYLIGRTYREMGEPRKAEKALNDVLSKYPKQTVAAFALRELIEQAADEMNPQKQVELWKKLTFDVDRTRDTQAVCAEASRSLAAQQFRLVQFNEGVSALATTYPVEQLSGQVYQYLAGPLNELAAQEKTKPQADKLADLAVNWFQQQLPGGASEEEKKKARGLWFHIADTQALSRRVNETQAAYDRIRREFGLDDETLGRFANWLKSQNRYDEARAEYAKYQNKAEGQNQIGYSYRQQQKYDLAVAAYEQAAAADPENAARWRSEAAQAWREARKYPEAIAIYQSLITSDAAKADHYMWMIGHCHKDAGQDKEAIGWFRQCSNFPNNYMEMAGCHRRQKQFNEAITLYGQIIAGSTQYAPWAMLQIGFTQEEAGSTEKAIQAFQQVCRKFPKDGHASQAHARLQDKYKISVTLGGAADE